MWLPRGAESGHVAQAGDTGHVMNLGHGIEATTPEPSAALFVDTVHAYEHK